MKFDSKIVIFDENPRMKTLRLLITISLLYSLSALHAQTVVNGDFEGWTDNPIDFSPKILNDWTTNNSGSIGFVSQTDGNTNTSGALLMPQVYNGKMYTAILSYGEPKPGTFNSFGRIGKGRPCTLRPELFQGFYTLSSQSEMGDSAALRILFRKFNPLTNTSDTIGYTYYQFQNSMGKMNGFSIPLSYLNPATPDTVEIVFTYNTSRTEQSYYHYLTLDDLSFGSPSGLYESKPQSSISIYPNPASDWIKVSTNSSEELNFHMYDAGGKLIHSKSLNADKTIAISSLPPGWYVLQLINTSGENAGEFRFVK